MRIFSISLILLLINGKNAIFTEKDEKYNEEEARMLFELIASVHNKFPENCLKRNLENPPELIAHFDIQCDVLSSKCTFGIFEIPEKHQLIVAIRGTQSKSQFFFEFMSFFIPDASFHGLGEVNYYFWVTHQVVWEKIHKILTLPEYSHHDVIFTGHSLGGSLSALSAFETVLGGVRNTSQVKLISMAEPRTGNFRFAKNFDANVKYSFRIINGLDVLAHLPACHKDYRFWPRADMPCDPRSVTGPYHHSVEVWYPNGMNKGDKYIICSGSQGEEFFCSDKIAVTVANFGKGITDHRKYFGKMISQYGKANCDRNRTFDENEGFLGKLKVASEIIHKLI